MRVRANGWPTGPASAKDLKLGRINMMTRTAFVCFLSAIGLAVGIARAESVMLTAKHKPGEKMYVEQTRESVQKIENSPMGGNMEMTAQQLYGLWRKVDSASADGAKVSLVFDRVMQRFESPMMSG